MDEDVKVRKLIDSDCKKHFRMIKFVNAIKWPAGFVLFLVFLIDTILAFTGKGITFTILYNIDRELINGIGNLLGILGLIWAIGVLFASFLCVFLQYLCSEKKVMKYKKKREKYYRQLFNSEDM